MKKMVQFFLTISLMCLAAAAAANAQSPSTAQGGGSFFVQCPKSTPFHPATYFANPQMGEPEYNGPTPIAPTLNGVPLNGADSEHPVYLSNGGQIKCQEV